MLSKRIDSYLWTELAPVLEGSVSRRRHLRKGMSVDRVCVIFFVRVDRRIFYSSSKTDSWWGTFAERNTNSGPLKRHPNTPIVSVSRMARRYTIQCSLPNTHTVYIELDGERQAGKDGGWEGARGWSKGRVGGIGSKGRKWGSDDVGESGSGSGGREGWLRKGISEEVT